MQPIVALGLGPPAAVALSSYDTINYRLVAAGGGRWRSPMGPPVGPKSQVSGGVVGATAAGRRAARRATNFSLAASLGCERAERAGDETLRDLGTRAPHSPRIIVQ